MVEGALEAGHQGRLVTSCCDTGQIPRSGGDGGFGHWGGRQRGGCRWLGFLAGLGPTHHQECRGKESVSLRQLGRCFAGVGRGPFQKDPEISGRTACRNMQCSCSAAANDLQIKVFVRIESFTRTNTHPKINFPFFLFL